MMGEPTQLLSVRVLLSCLVTELSNLAQTCECHRTTQSQKELYCYLGFPPSKCSLMFNTFFNKLDISSVEFLLKGTV